MRDRNEPQKSRKVTLEEAEVIKAYEDVIEKYAQTDIAAYCAMRLAGFYRRLGDVDRSVELLEATATEFAGTHEGSQVMYEAGLVHGQARNDQSMAMAWFKRIPEPQPPFEPKQLQSSAYHAAVKFYVLAQQQLAKCEVKLGENQSANDRIATTAIAYPEYAGQLNRSHEFEIASIRGKYQTSTAIDNRKPTNRIRVLMVLQLILVLVAVLFAALRKINRKRGE